MKNIIGLLSIILPSLIILLCILRVFVKRTQWINGLTLLFAIFLLLTGLIGYYAFGDKPDSAPDSKLAPVTVSKHSAAFNQSTENMLNAYFEMSASFAASDLAGISANAHKLKTALDSFDIEELKIDTLIYETALQPYHNSKAELAGILADPSLDEKRGSLNILSNTLFSLLSTVRYDREKLYWMECASAFGEDRAGNWISRTEQSPNPYGQENCMELKTTLDFLPADTTVKK